ncbi:uncharacterized protein K489DRAFT_384840 [Dissoconium aciculare CBS 342.82]|uniref:Chitin synthesis regulation, Congo red resistance, RCR protein n=1 Tax=Dissoconium aciculare CBS 342.82 TaxID=1314786 RepID=A0A6J3LS14_9PEZI|nr:uncharacterized protein K489DRAFT_384840 [Dissoconium aciculare CBS 342.82]KAF1818413.1 hypothetical protein K489DRAFT_384840 [Dissoconium aciculare CBS 342.82]
MAATCYDRYYNRYYTCSAWDRYGRWVFLGCIILFALFIFFLGSCISARRRRKLGYQPYRGTAWTLGRGPAAHGQATYNPNSQNQYQQQQQQQQPYYNNTAAPQYNATGHNGYYGNDNNAGVQQPGATYGGYNSGAPQYAPPPGKPPGH